MYWYVKLVLTLIITSFIALLLYIFRADISELSIFSDKEEVVQTQPEKAPSVVPPPGIVNKTSEEAPVKVAENPVVTKEEVKPEQPKEPAQPAIAKEVIPEELKKASDLVAKGKLVDARDLLWKYIESAKLTETSKEFWKAAEILDAINTKIIFTDQPSPEKVKHYIQPGDSLSRIAAKYNVPVTAIQKMNNRKPNDDKIFAGQVFYVYPGEWSIKVIKSLYKLIVYDKGRVFKVYNVATGRQDRTPTGIFTIKTKQINPDWTPPGRVIPFGHPENVLGTRWMGLKENKSNSDKLGYGIHGTNAPDSIGKSASNGCIRMRNPEVEELFNIVTYGTIVTIVE